MLKTKRSKAVSVAISKMRLLSLAGFCQVVPVQADFIDGLPVGINQTVTINSTDTAINVGRIASRGTLNNQGFATLTDFTDIFGTVNNYGLLVTKDVTHNGKTINYPGGHIVMTGYIDMYSPNSLFDNSGKVSVVNAVGNGGNVGTGAPFTYLFRGPIKNSGSFLIDRNGGNICEQSGIGTITNSGVFEVAKNTICNFAEQPETSYSKSTYVQTGGETKVNGVFGANVMQISGGKLSGDGTLDGSISFGSEVTIAPGADIGTLTIDNDITLDGSLNMEWGTPTIGHDQLAVHGTVDLNNASLNVAFRGNYAPPLGTTITLITADHVVGQVLTRILPIGFGGSRFVVGYTPTSVTLTATGG